MGAERVDIRDAPLMSFLFALWRDYRAAYHIAIGRYALLPWHFFLSSLAMTIMVVLNAIVPYLMGKTINVLAAKGSSAEPVPLFVLAGGYGVCWTVARVFDWLRMIMASTMLARCDAAFQHGFYAHLIRVKYELLIEKDPGAILSVLTRARVAFGLISTTAFWVIMPALCQLIIAGCMLWKLTSGGFSLFFVSATLLLFFVASWAAVHSKSAHISIFSAADKLLSHFSERLNFSLDIKLNNAYDNESYRSSRLLDDCAKKIAEANRKLASLVAIQAICAGVLLTTFTLLTAENVRRGWLSVGDFAMIVGYFMSLTMPFVSLGPSLSELRKNQLALREGLEILDIPLESSDAEAIIIEKPTQLIYDMRNITLRVAGRDILRDADLQIKVNELTVLIGPSGHGKSSLVYLMLGLIRPVHGTVLLFGRSISDLSVASITEKSAVAPQNPLILTGTVRENLSYGCRWPPSDAYLIQILMDLELLGVGDQRIVNVLDRELGVQGRELSGGERQRIAIGRALARQTTILILDEPTSSLDAEQERRIMARIRGYASTIIVVTHRHALLPLANCVYQIQAEHIVRRDDLVGATVP